MPAAKVRAQMKALGDVLLLSCKGMLPLLLVVVAGRSSPVIRGAFASSSSSAMLESS